jgi:hypothetical protein
MRDYLELGPTPCGEDCQQVGMPSYDPQMARKELVAYKNQLQRLFPAGVFGIKTFPHDFGSYSEVVAYFGDEMTEAQNKAAWDAEGDLPENWDQEALKELRLCKTLKS